MKTIYLVMILPVMILISPSGGDLQDMEQVEQEVWRTIEEMTTAWATHGDVEPLRNFFHENMVAITPDVRERIEGREACLAAYKDFVDKSTIHSWRDYDPEVQVYGGGNFAVVTCYWEMSFDYEGKRYDSAGRDMLVLVKEDGKWWLVADKYSAFPD
jgi:ketosteroid isomerase-like protein